MTGKRIVFTGGTGKAGRHAVPHLLAKGYSILNVDLKPLSLPGVNTLVAATNARATFTMKPPPPPACERLTDLSLAPQNRLLLRGCRTGDALVVVELGLRT